jgi:hypothetical protein
MDLLAYLFLLGLFLLFSSTCVIDNRSLYTVWKDNLQEDLSNNPHANKPPCINGTEVKLNVILRYFSFDTDSEIFRVYVWKTVTWSNRKLKWEPAKYGNIKELTLNNNNFWMPILKLYNRIEEVSSFYEDCVSKNNGEVTCSERVTEEVQCLSKPKNCPYELQNCSVEYGMLKT